MTLIAALLHHYSRLPSGYTWFGPLQILRFVLCREHIPTMIAAVAAIGALSAMPKGALGDLGARLGGQTSLAEVRPTLIRAALGGLGLLALGMFASQSYTPLDHIALVLLGGVILSRRVAPRQLARLALFAAFCAVVFMLSSYAFTIFKALLFVVRKPHDEGLMRAEQFLFGAHPHRLVAAWLQKHPLSTHYAGQIYFKLFEHMTLVSVLLTAMRRPSERTEYLSALCLCYLLGGLSYYLYPGAGPIYNDTATHLFVRVYHPMTDGTQGFLMNNVRAIVAGKAASLSSYDYIACMPSLHMAHELVMLYYSRYSKVALGLSLVFTSVTYLATLGLGWHYAIDVLGSLPLCALAIFIATWQRRRLFPASVRLGA